MYWKTGLVVATDETGNLDDIFLSHSFTVKIGKVYNLTAQWELC